MTMWPTALHAQFFKREDHPLRIVNDAGAAGNELIRNRPSGATSYWNPTNAGATMRVWKRNSGAVACPVDGLNPTRIIFLFPVT